VRYAIGGAFLLVGLFAAVVGGRVALTGRNMTGLLGRGFTKSDDLRMQRAPAVYFRAMGSLILSLGLLAVWVGAGFLTIGQEPSIAYLTTMLILAGLLVTALIASAVWITILAAQHKLFRWNKP
jgi:hypothetical protein